MPTRAESVTGTVEKDLNIKVQQNSKHDSGSRRTGNEMESTKRKSEQLRDIERGKKSIKHHLK